MNSQDFKKIEKKLPDTSGVYFFKLKKEVLYIGKATSLKNRVRSYFSYDILSTRGPKILKMLEMADTIDFQKTDSVLEALLLENYLIKKYQPEYNTKEKDNKSFNYIVITDEDFPRVLIVRGKDILISSLQKDKLNFKVKESFGPFPSGTSLREALKIIRKIFPFRDKCTPCSENILKNKKCTPCFNRQIGLCPGVCTSEIDKKTYSKNIKNISLFLSGQKIKILKHLEKEMKVLAKVKKFEEAGVVKKQIFALNHIQDVSLIKEEKFDNKGNFRIESYDIAHTSGKNVVGVMVVLENGQIKKSDYRKFKIKNNPENNDIKSLKEVLLRRLAHIEWKMPNLIVVDGGNAQKKAYEEIILENNLKIPVVSVVKDDKHKAKEIIGINDFIKYEKDILLSNNEAHRFAISWHRKIRGDIF